jgi:uncharacterized protein (DUF1697 family)
MTPAPHRYAALLRGINVGGVRIKMADLKACIEKLGHSNVKTVLASGNVMFDSTDTDITRLTTDLEHALTDRFGYGARALVMSTDRIADILEAYPFADRDDWHSYVVFYSDPNQVDVVAAVAGDLDHDQEQIAAGDSVLYWQVRKGDTLDSVIGKRTGARPKSATSWFVTSRNLNTLRKLH